MRAHAVFILLSLGYLTWYKTFQSHPLSPKFYSLSILDFLYDWMKFHCICEWHFDDLFICWCKHLGWFQPSYEIQTHVSLCCGVQFFAYKPCSGVARSYDTLNLSFHIDSHCGCTGKHSYQQMFMNTGQSYLEEWCTGQQNTCDVELRGIILEGIRGESEQGEMRGLIN